MTCINSNSTVQMWTTVEGEGDFIVGTGSSGHGSLGQRFWSGRVGSGHGSV